MRAAGRGECCIPRRAPWRDSLRGGWIKVSGDAGIVFCLGDFGAPGQLRVVHPGGGLAGALGPLMMASARE